MNKSRRKALRQAADLVEQAITLIDCAKDEEQDYLDNMPESFQEGDKGEKVREAIDTLETASDELLSTSGNLIELIEGV